MSIALMQHNHMDLVRLPLVVAAVVILIIPSACPYITHHHHHHHHLSEEQQFALQPTDQVAIVGARVILPCRVINKKGVLQWTRDDFGLGTRRRLAGFDRYSMIGSDEEGDYSLNISPVALEDDANYQWYN